MEYFPPNKLGSLKLKEVTDVNNYLFDFFQELALVIQLGFPMTKDDFDTHVLRDQRGGH